MSKISPYLAWLATAAFVFFQFFLQSSSTIMSEYWVRDFHLNEIELSNLSAAFFYAYIPMQVPAGLLYDRYNAKIILIFSAFTLSLGCLALGLVKSYLLAIIARFLMGLGAASGFVGLLKIIQINFSRERFVLMFGIAESIGMIGVALGLVGLAAFLKNFSWQNAMILSGTLAAFLGVLIYFFVENRKIEKKPFQYFELFAQIKSVVTNKQVVFCSIYGFFIISIMTCFSALWAEPFLNVAYDFDSQTNSLLLSMIFIGLAIGSPINGWFVKCFERHKALMLWEAGLSAFVTMIIIFVPHVPLAILFLLFFLVGFFCAGSGPCYALVNDAVNKESQATAVAFANMIVIASAPLLQIAIGSLLESHAFGQAHNILENYRIALSILPLSYVLAFIFGLFLKSNPSHKCLS